MPRDVQDNLINENQEPLLNLNQEGVLDVVGRVDGNLENLIKEISKLERALDNAKDNSRNVDRDSDKFKALNKAISIISDKLKTKEDSRDYQEQIVSLLNVFHNDLKNINNVGKINEVMDILNSIKGLEAIPEKMNSALFKAIASLGTVVGKTLKVEASKKYQKLTEGDENRNLSQAKNPILQKKANQIQKQIDLTDKNIRGASITAQSSTEQKLLKQQLQRLVRLRKAILDATDEEVEVFSNLDLEKFKGTSSRNLLEIMKIQKDMEKFAEINPNLKEFIDFSDNETKIASFGTVFEKSIGNVRRSLEDFEETLGGIPTGLMAVGVAAYFVNSKIGEMGGTLIDSAEKFSEFESATARASSGLVGFSTSGVSSLKGMKESFNLTMSDAEGLYGALSDLRSSTMSIDDVTNSMQGMIDTFGKVDTSILGKLVDLAKEIPKEQIDMVVGLDMDSSAEDKMNALTSMMRGGKLESVIELMSGGAFGKDIAADLGVELSEADKEIVKGLQDIRVINEEFQKVAYDAITKTVGADGLKIINGTQIFSKVATIAMQTTAMAVTLAMISSKIGLSSAGGKGIPFMGMGGSAGGKGGVGGNIKSTLITLAIMAAITKATSMVFSKKTPDAQYNEGEKHSSKDKGSTGAATHYDVNKVSIPKKYTENPEYNQTDRFSKYSGAVGLGVQTGSLALRSKAGRAVGNKLGDGAKSALEYADHGLGVVKDKISGVKTVATKGGQTYRYKGNKRLPNKTGSGIGASAGGAVASLGGYWAGSKATSMLLDALGVQDDIGKNVGELGGGLVGSKLAQMGLQKGLGTGIAQKGLGAVGNVLPKAVSSTGKFALGKAGGLATAGMVVYESYQNVKQSKQDFDMLDESEHWAIGISEAFTSGMDGAGAYFGKKAGENILEFSPKVGEDIGRNMGGALGGAMTGAMIGTMAGPLGIAIGTVAGSVIGAVGSEAGTFKILSTANKFDSLDDYASHDASKQISDRADKSFIEFLNSDFYKEAKEIEKNARQEFAKSLTTLEASLEENKRISAGVYASKEVQNIEVAEIDLENLRGFGGDSERGWKLQTTILNNSTTAYQKNIKAIEKQRSHILDNISNAQARELALQELYKEEQQVRIKLIESLEKNAGQFAKMPDMINNELKKALLQINIKQFESGSVGSNKGYFGEIMRSAQLDLDNLFKSVEGVGKELDKEKDMLGKTKADIVDSAITSKQFKGLEDSPLGKELIKRLEDSGDLTKDESGEYKYTGDRQDYLMEATRLQAEKQMGSKSYQNVSKMFDGKNAENAVDKISRLNLRDKDVLKDLARSGVSEDIIKKAKEEQGNLREQQMLYDENEKKKITAEKELKELDPKISEKIINRSKVSDAYRFKKHNDKIKKLEDSIKNSESKMLKNKERIETSSSKFQILIQTPVNAKKSVEDEAANKSIQEIMNGANKISGKAPVDVLEYARKRMEDFKDKFDSFNESIANIVDSVDNMPELVNARLIGKVKEAKANVAFLRGGTGAGTSQIEAFSADINASHEALSAAQMSLQGLESFSIGSSPVNKRIEDMFYDEKKDEKGNKENVAISAEYNKALNKSVALENLEKDKKAGRGGSDVDEKIKLARSEMDRSLSNANSMVQANIDALEKSKEGKNESQQKEIDNKITLEKQKMGTASAVVQSTGVVDKAKKALSIKVSEAEIEIINSFEKFVKNLDEINNSLPVRLADIQQQLRDVEFDKALQNMNFDEMGIAIKKSIKAFQDSTESQINFKKEMLIGLPKTLTDEIAKINTGSGTDAEKAQRISEAQNRANISRATATKQIAELEVGLKSKVAEYARKELEAKTSLVSLDQDLIDMEKDFIDTIGGTFESIIGLEAQSLEYERQKMNLAKETYETALKATGANKVSDEDLKKMRNESRRAELEFEKKRMGAQRSASEKFLGSLVGSFSSIGAFSGINESATFGSGYMVNEEGVVISGGNESGATAEKTKTDGYQKRVEQIRKNKIDPFGKNSIASLKPAERGDVNPDGTVKKHKTGSDIKSITDESVIGTMNFLHKESMSFFEKFQDGLINTGLLSINEHLKKINDNTVVIANNSVTSNIGGFNDSITEFGIILSKATEMLNSTLSEKGKKTESKKTETIEVKEQVVKSVVDVNIKFNDPKFKDEVVTIVTDFVTKSSNAKALLNIAINNTSGSTITKG